MPSTVSCREARPAVHAVAPPTESRIAPHYAGADLLDAFAVTLPTAPSYDIDALAHTMLGEPAAWFRVLLALRDRIMGGLGVKTSAAMRATLREEGVDHIDFFRVLSRDASEVIVGETDRHLDFHCSLLCRAKADATGFELVATTAVTCRNRLGHAYLGAIAPWHRAVVRTQLSSTARSAQATPRAASGARTEP